MAPKRKELIKESSAAPQVKKAKKDPIAEQLKEIISSWQMAPVKEDVKKMLAEILPSSLGEFSDKRHKFQVHVVDEVAGIMGEVERSLNKQITDTSAQKDEAVKEKPLREEEVAEAIAKAEAAKSEMQRLKMLLADSATTFRARTTSLAEAEESKKLDALKSQEAGKKKGDLETALEDLRFLKTSSLEESQAKQDELVMLLKKYKFEDSMLTALPVALSKAPESRGQFDLMAIGQLEAEIGKKASEQESILSAAKPDQEKCETVVQDAQKCLEESRQAQRFAAKSFDEASKLQTLREEGLTAAHKALRSLTSTSKRLEGEVYAAEAELEIFQQGPMETFKLLRERTTPTVVVEEEADVAPAVSEEQAEVVEQAQAMELLPEVPVVAELCIN